MRTLKGPLLIVILITDLACLWELGISPMVSKRIEVCGIINDLQVFLAAYTDRIMTMDIVAIDVPDS